MPRLERFAEIGFATGTRSAAMLGLGWDKALVNGHVDFGARTLHRAGPIEAKIRRRHPFCTVSSS
ncbi:hypothetical protein [Bosea sp. OK403]|uniref:hypothetical protein n=1 Tax=Bosea sp. OK403 TaxID=1855286 RepID=UPI0015874478|nr:hypothetical protein [Bosea sp. OK403]